MFEFLECLKKECSDEILLSKAENVKIAQLNYLKARLISSKPFKAEDQTKKIIELRNKIQKQITIWESITFSEIQNYCKNK